MAAVGELFSGRHDDAIRRLRRAIELDPNSNYAHGQLSAAYAFSGEAEAAIQQAQMAIRLSPRDFLNVIWHITTAWAHLSAERFQQAVDSAQQAIECNPAFADAHGVLAAACAYLGRMEDARASLDVFSSLISGSLTDQLLTRPFRRPADRERYFLGLHKAGLPEL
jgi:tetratricopeptide (TPR) repeat protein